MATSIRCSVQVARALILLPTDSILKMVTRMLTYDRIINVKGKISATIVRVEAIIHCRLLSLQASLNTGA